MQQIAISVTASEHSITLIAQDSGHEKQRSFNKTFETIFNMTPAAYRKLQGERVAG